MRTPRKVFIDWMSKQSADWAGAGMIPARNVGPRGAPTFTDSAQDAIAEQIDDVHFLPPVPGLGDVQAQTLEVAVERGGPRASGRRRTRSRTPAARPPS